MNVARNAAATADSADNADQTGVRSAKWRGNDGIGAKKLFQNRLRRGGQSPTVLKHLLSQAVGGVVDYTERKGRGPDGHSSFLEKERENACKRPPPVMLESTLERSGDEEATSE
jgi:hypothetical protein